MPHENIVPHTTEGSSIRSNVEPSDSNWANKYEDFDIGKPIGYGSSAIVFGAIYKPLKKRVALKMIDLDMFERNQIDELRRETTLMALSKHPNILRVYGSFVIESKLYIVTPYLSAGSCLDIMKTSFPSGLDEISIATILRQSLEGLCYLHKNGHIHRDVKAGNLLMDQQGNVLLADFGVSSSLSENGDVRKTFVGTPCWMAPEVMEQAAYNFKADLWSFGITAIELATGHAPFAKYPPMKVLMMTLSNAPPTLDRDHCKHKYSKAFKDMIDCCLQKDPSKRPSAEKLMLHPFFKLAKRKEYLVKYILPIVPPLDKRPNKKVPEKTVCCENTEQWDFDTPENDSIAAEEPRLCQAQEKSRQTAVQFQEKPKPLQVARMRSTSNEGSPMVAPDMKKHISFGEVTISDNSSVKSLMAPVKESPSTSSVNALSDNASTPAGSKKSRFVVADNSDAIHNSSVVDHYDNNNTQGTNLPIPNDASNIGLGISDNLTSGSSLVSTPSVHSTEIKVKKGRFSVNQTPTLRPVTDSPYDLTEKYHPINELKPSPMLRSSSQDSLQSERKSRFGVKVSTSTLPAACTLESTTPIQSTPITRENSNGSVLSRESKISRFSVEKNESSSSTTNHNSEANITPVGCLSPESRKKGRFELTGGTNTPNDNFKLDKEISYEYHTFPSSPAISPNNTLLKGQSYRLTDTSTTHLMQGHLEYLIKQSDIQKNILSELISGLPSQHLTTQPTTITRRRTLSDAKHPVLPEDFQTKIPLHSIPNNSLNSDINNTIEHLQQLVITSFKEKDKLVRENEDLRREVECLRRNQSNGSTVSKKSSFDQGLSQEYYRDHTPEEMV